jgi:hypothetical protein
MPWLVGVGQVAPPWSVEFALPQAVLSRRSTVQEVSLLPFLFLLVGGSSFDSRLLSSQPV